MKHIAPFWNDYHLTLDYTVESFRDQEQLTLWKESGHNLNNLTIDLCQNNSDDNFTDAVKQHFTDLSNIGVSFHRLRPGHFLPMHVDKYRFYANKHNITDLNKIKRYVIFLEDSKPGHMLVVDDVVYSKWSAGDLVGWHGETPHSAINLGMFDRYTLQVTGIVNEQR